MVVFAMLAATIVESETVPVKLSRLFTVIVAVDDEPCTTVILCGVGVRAKSGFVPFDSLHAVRAWISHPE